MIRPANPDDSYLGGGGGGGGGNYKKMNLRSIHCSLDLQQVRLGNFPYFFTSWQAEGMQS
jgi:hypothetical protein